jgi:2-polyprenyl-6-methoxyphenol hydroxylase-like FAD-dependent oxidoreductase
MPTTIVAGGSIAGLGTALALGTAGYRVVVLESDPAPPEGDLVQAAQAWHRPSAPQASHSHNLTGLGMRILSAHAPQVMAAVLAAGAELLDLTTAMPPGASHRHRRAGDEELVALGCRRTTLELALHRTARNVPGVDIRHCTAVRGLLLDDRRSRATGVVTDDGRSLTADAVIDATGRRCASKTWLRAAGVPTAEDRLHPSGLAVYTRFYRCPRSGGRPGPLNRGNAAGGVWDHYAGFVHLGDDATHSVVLTVLPGDPVVRALRHTAVFTAAARATPWLAAWADAGEPLTPVLALNCPPTVLRSAATGGPGTIAGLYLVGDAACVTNPLFGRGMSLALAHAFTLGGLLAETSPDDPGLTPAAARRTLRLMKPWYEHSVRADDERSAHWRRSVAAGPAPHGPARQLVPARASTAQRDGLVWRDLMRMLMTLAPYEEDPTGLWWHSRAHIPGTQEPPAPTRHGFVRLLTAAGGR